MARLCFFITQLQGMHKPVCFFVPVPSPDKWGGCVSIFFLAGCLACVKQILFKIGDDWFFLFALGVITALISFTMDFIVAKMLNAHRWLYQELGDNMLLKYLSWTVYPTAMTAFSTGFAQSVSPQSAGSGIPELKTILTGVVLEEYLTVKNMGAKIVGMTCTLAAGSPIFLGKVGPFVHLSSMIATYLGRIRASVTKAYEVGGSDGTYFTVLTSVNGLSSIFFNFLFLQLTMKELLTSFFDNRTWIVLSKNASLPRPPSVDPNNLWIEWWDPTITIYGTLLVFIVMKFWMLILATTMPMPAGYFMPVFIYGEYFYASYNEKSTKMTPFIAPLVRVYYTKIISLQPGFNS
uniref:Chloride channel K n=1 Tax=Erpetoichthys calabaricus TaxID=27687 RepID=A0A8C4S1U8_ERPCA